MRNIIVRRQRYQMDVAAVSSLLLSLGYLVRQRISRYRVMQLSGFSWLDRFPV
jgi:hypothetical protein